METKLPIKRSVICKILSYILARIGEDPIEEKLRVLDTIIFPTIEANPWLVEDHLHFRSVLKGKLCEIQKRDDAMFDKWFHLVQ